MKVILSLLQWRILRYIISGGTAAVANLSILFVLVHFEDNKRSVDNESKVKEARDEILTFMNGIGFSELSQDRLERMFAHYNKHWNEYYGTDKMFVIK